MVCEQIRSEAISTKEKKLSKKSQEEEDEINRKLHKANKVWNDGKFQIHWNKLEWVNPRSCDEQTIHFVCVLKNCFKNNVKNAHWVDQLQLISLDTDYLFKNTHVVDDIQDIVTVSTIKQSAPEKKPRFVTKRRIKLI